MSIDIGHTVGAQLPKILSKIIRHVDADALHKLVLPNEVRCG